MNKAKKMLKESEVYWVLYSVVLKRGYFDYWLNDYEEVMLSVSETCKVSQTFVKRIFWKKFAIENKELLEKLEY